MRNIIRRKSDPAAYLKAALRTARYRAFDALGMVKPLKLRIGLTNRCNARCIMCNVWKQCDNEAPALERELRVDELVLIFERNKRFLSQLNHISLTGGEPTLRRDFVEVMRTIHRFFPELNVSINSNGFTTQRILGLVEQVLEFHPRFSVMVSLDALGEAHDRVRGVPGAVGRVLKTIEGLCAFRERYPAFKVETNTVLTPINAADADVLYKFCRENRVSYNPIYCVQGELYFNEQQDNVSLTPEARSAYIAHFSGLLEHDDSLQTREIMDQLLDRPRDFNCWAGRIMMLVEENGDVFPNGGCPADFVMGNLRQHDYSFAQLLAAPEAKKVLTRTLPCRLCRLSCETMTTLRHPEALEGYRKSREMPVLASAYKEVQKQDGKIAKITNTE